MKDLITEGTQAYDMPKHIVINIGLTGGDGTS